MTITIPMAVSFLVGYLTRELIGFIYREGVDRGKRQGAANAVVSNAIHNARADTD